MKNITKQELFEIKHTILKINISSRNDYVKYERKYKCNRGLINTGRPANNQEFQQKRTYTNTQYISQTHDSAKSNCLLSDKPVELKKKNHKTSI